MLTNCTKTLRKPNSFKTLTTLVNFRLGQKVWRHVLLSQLHNNSRAKFVLSLLSFFYV